MANTNALSPPNKPGESVGGSSLSQTYKDIAFKALTVGEDWPDSTNANLLFSRTDDGAYLIPSFPEQDAPLAVVAILDRNKEARRILKECDLVFDSFVNELIKVLACPDDAAVKSDYMNDLMNRCQDEQKKKDKIKAIGEELERYLWRIPEGSHHITVAVFQEHPSILLDVADKLKWRRVEEAAAEKIYHRVSTYREKGGKPIRCPQLELDSLLLTGDGAMIAGFIDTTADSSFQKIRVSSSEIAASIIGDLTSRPKKLIHATVGRVLAVPSGLSPTQKHAVASLVRRYNTEVLPQKVSSLHDTLAGGPAFALTQLTMIRDVVWTLRKIKEYGSWRLAE